MNRLVPAPYVLHGSLLPLHCKDPRISEVFLGLARYVLHIGTMQNLGTSCRVTLNSLETWTREENPTIPLNL